MQKDTVVSEGNAHKSDTPTHPLVVVETVIRAEPAEVFKAWSEENLVKQWWGPEGYTCPHAKIDFRVGGRCLCEMKSADQDMWSVGTYLEIVPNKKIVCTDNFSNSQGDIISAEEAGMGPMEGLGDAFITVELEPIGDGSTRMTLSHEGLPAKMHDECVGGWSSSFEKLKRVIERH